MLQYNLSTSRRKQIDNLLKKMEVENKIFVEIIKPVLRNMKRKIQTPIC